MNIYELFEISNKPKKNDSRYSNYRVYNNSLYIEAECIVDCMPDEDVTDENYDELVEKALEDIMGTLKTYGRYPATGIPKYVAY
jgi:hypothetical protein